MAKKSSSRKRFRSGGTISDGDWVTIIAALLGHKSKDSQDLAAKLLDRTRHGRQIRLLRYIRRHEPTIPELQRGLKISRRTIFRYLRSLEDNGVTIWIDGGSRYHVDGLPDLYKPVV